ncbi:MAG: OmpA family protein [Microlunatus sp.]
MSRSSEMRHRRAARLVITGSVAVGLLTATVAVPAVWATPTTPDDAPIMEITAPVVDIQFGMSTLDGRVAVEDRKNGSAARLDSTVLFGKDSAQLRLAALKVIDSLARDLRKGGPGKITVTGYTDDLGSAAHGLKLSKQRAAAVAGRLEKSLGSDWPEITVVGKGEADPAVPNKNEKNRKLNRRVIVTVKR